VLVWCCRQKRAAHEIGDSHSTPIVGPRVPNDLITSPDTAGPPPVQPIHQGSVFPTAGNITEQAARDACRGELERSPLYQQCLNYTLAETDQYMSSCMEDIKVSHALTCLLTMSNRKEFVSTPSHNFLTVIPLLHIPGKDAGSSRVSDPRRSGSDLIVASLTSVCIRGRPALSEKKFNV